VCEQLKEASTDTTVAMLYRRMSEKHAREYVDALKRDHIGDHCGALHLETALLEDDFGEAALGRLLI
jgi:hypothetical protein